MIDKKTLLFLVGCMGTRLGLVWVSKTQPQLLQIMALLAACISFGFMYIWAMGSGRRVLRLLVILFGGTISDRSTLFCTPSLHTWRITGVSTHGRFSCLM